MKVRKAVITAAARGERLFPVADTIQKAMLPVADIDGLYKPAIQIIAEEAFSSGIEELCVICAPGDGDRYRAAFGTLRDNWMKSFRETEQASLVEEKMRFFLERVRFIEQEEPLGYGHAVYCARDFVNDEPFLLLLGDYLYVSSIAGKRCAAQLLELASDMNCSVSAVNPTPEHLISNYGTLTGKQVAGRNGTYRIEQLIEKPSLSVAELRLQTAGLRSGYYLCFFGMHVFTPAVFALLEKHIGTSRNVLLTPVLQELADLEAYLALEVKGSRYDLSRKHGLLRAQVALGLAGEAQAETLSTLVELLAEANLRNSR